MHILDRLRTFIGGKADTEILEGALILVVVINIVAVGPAVWSQNAELVRETALQLILAAIATALCLGERGYKRQKPAVVTELAATPRGAPWYSPFR